MSLPPSLYRYSSLPEDSIRLLRLLPHQDEHAPIQCQLFDCALLDSGSTRPQLRLARRGKPLHRAVTSSGFLHRTNHMGRCCLHQPTRPKEKGKQVQSMAKIYAKASGVIVWLGEATPDGGQALEDIRIAAAQRTKLSINESAIFRLLERPWFQRIWVLQEVAAARHVLIKCGPIEIDGYAFCSGLSVLNLSYEAHPSLQPLIRSVAYLIRGAAFRPRCATNRSGRFSLDICSLGELVDMYHTRKATEPRDKVYALLGMSSDDPSIAGLSVNYEISWGEVFKQLVNFFFPERVSVETWGGKEIAVIRGKGCALGQVSSVERDVDREDQQHVAITWEKESIYGAPDSRWTLQASAKSVQKGDAICLLQGASTATIIRPCNHYWAVVMIAVPLPDHPQSASRDTKSELLRVTTAFPHDLLLVWDWNVYPDESLDRKDYEHFMGTSVSKYPRTELEDRLDTAIRLRDTGVVLEYMRRFDAAEKAFRKATEILESALTSMGRLETACSGHGRWRKEDVKRLEGMVGLLIKNKGGWMPLWLGAKNGREAIVKLLLGTNQVDPNAKDGHERTPLSLASENGHEAIVKLLLGTNQVDPNAKNGHVRTPLSLASENGHEAIVKLLLGTGRVNPGAADSLFGETPILWAVRGGREAIVKLLLDTGRVDLSTHGETLLRQAVASGHKGIVKLLLDTGKVNLNAKDRYGRTLLSLMVKNGNEAIVKLLQIA
ncbi:uncharacterized protein NECHADRAFT_86213 [Fusarium vanettenii 77-13-4]|uniref:Heterokaryon incompatibility domain-containing protein n=1 Tax=Fusarium vanettenii (strain ATCC MYA-4622 / CBS 123669 / FGSC 9596 / NRRL 45880 / 77-13-4) TaxID=660122 RepID=C7ZKN3_FUSV7|nr:uncharacterized protein NECHADRAFT_86213 [Fusarium vanettenii 77-13-4]EEU35470.1 hypothetical protein NECHADRAFT_86213 [Fusarium vanettenii 77-13-4]